MRLSMRCTFPKCRPFCRISFLLCTAISATVYCYTAKTVLTVVMDAIYEDHMVLYWLGTIAFVILISSAVVAQFRLPFSNPGVLRPDVEAADSENWKQTSECSVCSVTRPLGTHHCRVCNVCVLLREHHCPWINNCVGANNQWLFISFVVFILLASLVGLFFCLFNMIYYSCSKCTRPELWWPVAYTILLAVFLVFSSSGLLVQQILHLGLRAKAVLEEFEKERGPAQSDGDRMVREVGAWSAAINQAFGKQVGLPRYLIVNPFWSYR